MRRMLLMMIVFALSMPLLASVEKTATWAPPTQRVNGDALPPGEIAGYDIECSRVSNGEIVYATVVPAEATSHQTGDVFDEGSFVCNMRTFDTGGRSSDWASSNVFTVGRCEVTDCRPQPPSNITVHF